LSGRARKLVVVEKIVHLPVRKMADSEHRRILGQSGGMRGEVQQRDLTITPRRHRYPRRDVVLQRIIEAHEATLHIEREQRCGEGLGY
jgi:hypothetical protein